MKKIAIVICNFNKKEYLRLSLESILNADFKGTSRDIIVVDNASSDGSDDMIHTFFPEIILIQTGMNLGGAGGFAVGMQYAKEKGYSYITVLDNDTRCAPDVFIKLTSYLENDPSLGVAGATILQMDTPNKIQEMGAKVDFENYSLSLNYTHTSITELSLPNELICDYVPACCFMTKLEVVEKIGVFDKDYFIYFDDVDWNTRAKQAGYIIKAFKDVHVWHKGGAKLLTNTFAQYYSYRNMIRYFLKYIDHDRFEHFSSSFCERIQKAIFFSNLKNEFNSTKSILLAIDDAYINKLGAQFGAIFPKENQINKFYDICLQKKDILIINHTSLDLLEKILHNIQEITQANVTFTDDPAEIATKEYDLVCHAVGHILESSQSKNSDAIFIDPFGNYVVDSTDALKVAMHDQFSIFFNQTLRPILQYKFETIFKELHS